MKKEIALEKAREKLKEYAKILEDMYKPQPGDDQMRESLATLDGIEAFAQSIKNQPNLEVAKSDAEFIFARLYGRDNKDKINEMMLKIGQLIT